MDEFRARAAEQDTRLADVLLVAAWTGWRSSELREARVRDSVRVPMPVLLGSRAAPEGGDAKGAKSGRVRRVPVAEPVLQIIDALGGRAGIG